MHTHKKTITKKGNKWRNEATHEHDNYKPLRLPAGDREFVTVDEINIFLPKKWRKCCLK